METEYYKLILKNAKREAIKKQLTIWVKGFGLKKGCHCAWSKKSEGKDIYNNKATSIFNII